MDNDVSSLNLDIDRVQEANVIHIQSYVFRENTFRSRKPREEGPFALAGRIKNRDEMSMQGLLLND